MNTVPGAGVAEGFAVATATGLEAFLTSVDRCTEIKLLLIPPV